VKENGICFTLAVKWDHLTQILAEELPTQIPRLVVKVYKALIAEYAANCIK
jgi:hypothetical protein